MKQGLTEIIVVMDKSGSMDMIKGDAIGGFNSMLDEQKKLPGEAKLTLTLFDTVYDIVYNGKPIQDVPHLGLDTYRPGGMTALLDAVGRTIHEVGVRLKATAEDDRPEKVIMVIITDGAENSSKEYTNSKLSEVIKHQQDVYKWEFVFLGANQDAFHSATSIGVKGANSCNFAATGQGIKRAYLCANQAMSSYRTSGSVDMQKGVQ